MDVQEVHNQVRIQEWVELIKERNSSGMAVREWCEAKGLSENQYYYWLRKIRSTASFRNGDNTLGHLSDLGRSLANLYFIYSLLLV